MEDGPALVGDIQDQKQFKELCDGLLRHEFGPFVQTYSGESADQGVDAEYVDADSGERWVFQYKFSKQHAPSARSAITSACKTEFRKTGPKGCAAYALLTNVPVTRDWCLKLRDEWTKSGHDGRFVVWGPSTLNPMLKGREFLARSWSGVFVEKCRTDVAERIRIWLDDAVRRTRSWEHDPLWPIRLRQYQLATPVPSVESPLEVRNGVRPKLLIDELIKARAHPLFTYAKTVAFPAAFSSLDSAQGAVESIGALIESHIEQFAPEIQAVFPLDFVDSAEDRRDIVLALSKVVLEARWGMRTSSSHRISEQDICVEGGLYVHQDPEGRFRGLRKRLDGLVAAAHQRVPADVVEARHATSIALNAAHAGLWSVAELGIDSPGT